MKKLAAMLVLAYLIISGMFFAVVLATAPVGGKILISAVLVLQFKYLLTWSLITIGVIGGIDLLKEKHPEAFEKS
jgi:hypothetical protein